MRILSIFRKRRKTPAFLVAFSLQRNIRACKEYRELLACEAAVEKFLDDYKDEAKPYIRELSDYMQVQSVRIQIYYSEAI